ncbi:MAG: phosphopentomutase [Acidobacteriota bacterium]|nr:phosphopentomutase [Acidobacteriota bacterium]
MAATLPDRVILIVLDSVGVGELPDAASYADEGSNTVGNVARVVPLRIPGLRSLGLDRIVDIGERSSAEPIGAYGRMAERSPGKDSVTGHWEIAGLVLERPFPTFPNGFPADVIVEFERRIGRGSLANTVASGTAIIEQLGDEHVKTGKPIVYTSADSVFQIAAHEDVVPVEELYRWCEAAFDIVGKGIGVARVIARPFCGESGAYKRTANRRDFALTPFAPTLLDVLKDAGHPVVAVGKIEDLFAGRGITEAVHTAGDDEGMDEIAVAMEKAVSGLIFANLVDFDTRFGHRNLVAGYAENLEKFDLRLVHLLPALRENDLLVVTADHGNDPTTPSTDHSREYVPLMVAGARVKKGVDLGTRQTFADLGQTIADLFGAKLANGTSFLADILDPK